MPDSNRPRHRILPRAERLLLENLVDALDRLFDGQCHVIDVYAIAFATSLALIDSTHSADFVPPIEKLLSISRTGGTKSEQRAMALADPDIDRLRFIVSNIVTDAQQT